MHTRSHCRLFLIIYHFICAVLSLRLMFYSSQSTSLHCSLVPVIGRQFVVFFAAICFWWKNVLSDEQCIAVCLCCKLNSVLIKFLLFFGCFYNYKCKKKRCLPHQLTAYWHIENSKNKKWWKHFCSILPKCPKLLSPSFYFCVFMLACHCAWQMHRRWQTVNGRWDCVLLATAVSWHWRRKNWCHCSRTHRGTDPSPRWSQPFSAR